MKVRDELPHPYGETPWELIVSGIVILILYLILDHIDFLGPPY